MWQLWTMPCVIASIMYNQAQAYLELTTVRVCSSTFSGNDGIDGMFNGIYTRNGDVFYERDAFTFFTFSDQNDYRFVGTNGGVDIILKLSEEAQQEQLFNELYSNDGCDCSVTADITTSGTWRLEGLNGWGTPAIGLCATWTDIGTTEVPAPVTPADEWHCVRECDELTAAISVSYQGFEVFSDPNCMSRKRTNSGEWRCRGNGCVNGYFPFKIRGETGQARHKCQSCETYFGGHCSFCERQTGCQQCDGTPGFGIIGATSDCDWQYCGELCCEEDLPSIPTPDPTPQPTGCDEDGPVGGGSGSTDYDCRTDAEREADSPVYGNYPLDPTKRYFLPEPITNPVDGCDLNNLAECLGDCNNKVPFKCPGTDDNCLEEPIDGCNDDQPFDLRGCAICKCSDQDPDPAGNCVSPDTEYWWFSNAVPCASCLAIKDCLTCKNGGDYGRGGCAQCDSGFHAAYDEEIGVIYCEANVAGPTLPPSPFPEPGDDGWEGLTCPEPCGGDERFGENNRCFCGCECNVCEEEDFTNNCADCEYHAGCAECENNNEDSTQDFWMKDYDYPCERCSDRFGSRCSFCNDFFGCAQCEPGYLHTYSNCCDLWYCVLAPTNT